MISVVGPRAVAALHALALHTLSLEACPRLADWSLPPLAPALAARLHTLSLRLCTRLSDRSLGHVVEFFPALRSIDVRGIASLTDASIQVRVCRGVCVCGRCATIVA
jgi:hypothetical protein